MAEEKKQRIQFLYREAPGYRSVHPSGAFGGIVPSGEIFMGVYTERTHFPNLSWVDVDSTGKAMSPEGMRVEPGVVRQMEVGLSLDLKTAQVFRDWLTAHISALEMAVNEVKIAQEAESSKKDA